MNDLTSILSEPVARLGASTITLGHALAFAVLLFLGLFVALVIALWRSAKARAVAAAEAADHARDAEARMAGILQSQAEMQGRMGAIAEVFGARQAELTQSIGQRLDAMTGRLGQTMTEQTKSTHESLAKLQERLAIIDVAQGNIPVARRPGRAAAGDPRQQADARRLRPGRAWRRSSPTACRTAPTNSRRRLSNGSRPDCLVHMPNGAPSLAIDAKFPLEAWNAIRAADGAEAAEGRLAGRSAATSRSMSATYRKNT